MTFRIISNTYGSSQQPPHVAAGSGNACTTLNNSQQLQQHQLSPGAGEHLCTRFCCFEPVFGNVFRCQTSGITHVCDQGCSERIFLDNHFDICRFSKKLFPSHKLPETASRKRCLADSSTGGSNKRSNVTSPSPMATGNENVDGSWL
ncbi:hypothetical protein ABBQ32_007786 [Trebouxia sp. C0010 RCD-2024]